MSALLTRHHQCGLLYRFVFFNFLSIRWLKSDVTDSRVYLCRYPTRGVSRLAETMGTRWFMVWVERQLGILLLGSHDRVGEDQLEERRGCEGRECS